MRYTIVSATQALGSVTLFTLHRWTTWGSETLNDLPKSYRFYKAAASKHKSSHIKSSIFKFFFYGCTCCIWKFPAQRLNQSCSCWPIPQWQQSRIRVARVTCTTAHGNARSFTYWARPAIKPASSWILVEFVSPEPQWELQGFFYNSAAFPIYWSVAQSRCSLYCWLGKGRV